jgi:hypothetical protein
MSSTITTVPKDSTFKLPPGRYKAVITHYKTNDVDGRWGKSQSATILFEVFVPGMENYECLARKVVPVDLRAGSPMRTFLESLLGPQYFKSKSNQAIDLHKLLVGQLCEVDLIHAKHDEDRFDFPLVDIDAMHPPQPEQPKEADPKKGESCERA